MKMFVVVLVVAALLAGQAAGQGSYPATDAFVQAVSTGQCPQTPESACADIEAIYRAPCTVALCSEFTPPGRKLPQTGLILWQIIVQTGAASSTISESQVVEIANSQDPCRLFPNTCNSIQIDSIGGGSTPVPPPTPLVAEDVEVTTKIRRAVTGSFNVNGGAGAVVYQTSQPRRGTVTVSGSTFTYTPRRFFFGRDTFTYTATDGLTTDTATVTVKVTLFNVNAVIDKIKTRTASG